MLIGIITNIVTYQLCSASGRRWYYANALNNNTVCGLSLKYISWLITLNFSYGGKVEEMQYYMLGKGLTHIPCMQTFHNEA